MREDYDGYVIATPAKTHYEIAKKVINSKKPILIEKPLTLAIEEAEELFDLANQKVNAMVGHVLLFILQLLR